MLAIQFAHTFCSSLDTAKWVRFMKILSIIIPAYNEARYIGTLLPLVQAVPTEMYGFTKEIIVVDDGSSDNTFEIVAGHESVRCIRQASNQ